MHYPEQSIAQVSPDRNALPRLYASSCYERAVSGQDQQFFLDSLATAKSVCRELAGRIKIKFAQRDIFLDNVANGEYIKSQLKKLSVRAKEKGYAVGIGHDRPVTIEALIKNMPEMASDGIDFIFLSEIEERK